MKLSRFSARAVIFDWDGTLLNSFQADVRAYRAMFDALQVSFSDRDLARHYSPDWYRVYRAAGIPRAKWSLADSLWAEAYRHESPHLMRGTTELLHRLRPRYSLGLVTSGDRSRVRRQLKHFGLVELFDACICSRDARRRKPHPAPLQKAMQCMRVQAADCVYVGDTPEDVEMARRAGVRSIAVVGPFPSSVRLKDAGPTLLLDSITGLWKVLAPADEP